MVTPFGSIIEALVRRAILHRKDHKTQGGQEGGGRLGNAGYGCNLCGHGHFDMQADLDYFAGRLREYEYPAEEIAMALAGLPSVGG
jgi:hypothetical protein